MKEQKQKAHFQAEMNTHDTRPLTTQGFLRPSVEVNPWTIHEVEPHSVLAGRAKHEMSFIPQRVELGP